MSTVERATPSASHAAGHAARRAHADFSGRSRASKAPHRRVLTLRGCSVTDLRVDLLVTQLKAAIRRLLEAKGIRARVLDKVNRYGEVVIGIILEKPPRDQGRGGT
jgi:hypothetical protein